ncbi:glutamine synthetase type I [Cavenderia fasciculata]|uniref:Glutamine synthetase type I n=1 Tax=Cavenderia fasciculata TaxID=261658 RepID=F4PXE2_CACFS|nr:glutamine synthetase type I [Cavenderia fasciculata]EGG19452.1 glutamine synthetase type I [Cavenderia fasciculata]|eukprot:XP_004357746.1 glutamine synthetase type I [Cavenderia fasciculata]
MFKQSISRNSLIAFKNSIQPTTTTTKLSSPLNFKYSSNKTILNNHLNNEDNSRIKRYFGTKYDEGRMTPEDLIINQVKNSSAPMVKVAGSDIDGILRGKYLQKEKFESAATKGLGFCSVIFGWDSEDQCYDNVQFTGNHTGYPDIGAKPDLGTFRLIPWENNTPFFLIDFYKTDDPNKPLPICPRNLLKKVIKDCREAGFEPMMGMEFEWYNYLENNQTIYEKDFMNLSPLTNGMFGYSLLRVASNSEYANTLAALKDYGIPLEGLHTETGPGVYEVAIQFSDALEAADRAILFKLATKEIGAKFGIMASFMAKPSTQLPGCSGHMHQNFQSLDGKTNLFADSKGEISETFKSFLAGQLQLLPEFLPFFAPTINSYKRLVDGYWAPTTPTWGYDNRTVAIRVIKGGKATRSEFRVTGSDVNPYIAIAASFAAGLYGVKNKLKLTQEPIVGNSYDLYKKGLVPRLPRTLSESTELLAKSDIAKELLGEEFIDHFVQTRRWEYRTFNHQVHRWETQRYFEVI